MGWWSSLRFDRRVRMRAPVRGAVNDVRTSILLDIGANVSIITTKLARRLRPDPVQEHGCQLEVQGIQEGKMSTTTRVKAKVTLGWNTVYEFEFCVMDHSAGSEVVLSTDFMIPAGIRLDLFNATAKLPGEEMVPLVKSLSADEDSAEGMHVTCGPTKSLRIPAGEWIEFHYKNENHLRLTNITDRVVYCPAHLNVIAWVPEALCQSKLVTCRSILGSTNSGKCWLMLDRMMKLGSSWSVSCTNDGWHNSHPRLSDSPTHDRLAYCRNSTSTRVMVTIPYHKTINGVWSLWLRASTVRPTAHQWAMIRLALRQH
ncbi:Eukaryotic/viral aspartic protease [Phytophthora megakarya]|uniref:Eukaryotic/viral aspartic protease n=1 Tax=Phytophthora megakarya TaxID=4795 RepID=A0A225USU2_9STRA|nr:Eukaryotic/viral aspartic protease [Phytophthora megakarya]